MKCNVSLSAVEKNDFFLNLTNKNDLNEKKKFYFCLSSGCKESDVPADGIWIHKRSMESL